METTEESEQNKKKMPTTKHRTPYAYTNTTQSVTGRHPKLSYR